MKKYKNVLCIYPYRYQNPYYVFPPLALEYLAGAIEDLVEKVTIVDMRFEEELRPYLEGVDLVCAFGHWEDCAIFGQLKEDLLSEIARQVPDSALFVAGGSNTTDIEGTFARLPRLDIIVRGSPEYPIRKLIQQGSPQGIPNLVWRNQGGIIRNEHQIFPIPNDILPARHLRRYRYQAAGIDCDIIRTSMGCNYRCRFCYQYGKDQDTGYLRWQGRTAESIFEELKTSQAIFVGIIDDDFLVDMERVDKLCDLIIAGGMKKMFAATSRINYIIGHEETLRKMEKAGFLALSYGIESPHEKTLRFYRKGLTSKMNEEGLRLHAKTKILLFCSFILGSPGETKEEILEILKFARKFDIDTVVTNRLRIPQESELYKVLYDPTTGRPRQNPEYKRIEGEELAQLKMAIKYGQRTPLRILLTLMKLTLHKGMPLDPFFILTSFIKTTIKGTWLDRAFPTRALFNLALFVFSRKAWRIFNKSITLLFYPPLKAINWVIEQLDDRLGISILILPKIFGLFYRQVYYPQKLHHGWRKN